MGRRGSCASDAPILFRIFKRGVGGGGGGEGIQVVSLLPLMRNRLVYCTSIDKNSQMGTENPVDIRIQASAI